jgi:hypothetical protein
MAQHDLILIAILFNQLEIPCRGLAHPPVEVKGVAPSLLIILGWEVFKVSFLFVLNNLYTERSRLLCKKVCIVFYGAHPCSYREEPLRDIFLQDVARVQSKVVDFKSCPQKVGHQDPQKTSAVDCEILSLIRNDEFSILCIPLSM